MRRLLALVVLGLVGLGLTLAVQPNLVLGLRSPRVLLWLAGGALLCAAIGLLARRMGAAPPLALAVAAVPALVAVSLVVVKPIVSPREAHEAIPEAAVTPAPAPSASASATARPAPERTATGRLSGLDGHRASGRVSTYRLGDGSVIVRFEGVRISGTPTPHVYLLPGSDRTGKRGGVHLGGLKAERGSFNYPMPAAFVGTEFTVLVWCERFAVNVAHATVR